MVFRDQATFTGTGTRENRIELRCLMDYVQGQYEYICNAFDLGINQNIGLL
jgi:hypothetical protein